MKGGRRNIGSCARLYDLKQTRTSVDRPDHMSEKSENTTVDLPPVAVDLFCGAGGLSCGLQKAGIDVVAGIDSDSNCKHPFEYNIKARFCHLDIGAMDTQFVAGLFPDQQVRVLAGCAPCQPYSQYAHKHSAKDGRWQLLAKFAEIVDDLRPEIVTMENVPQLQRHSIFQEFIDTLRQADYAEPDISVADCSRFGVPQSRKRLVVLASRLGNIRLEAPEEDISAELTVRKFIGEWEEIDAGSASTSDPIHRASGLSPTNRARIVNSRPGGTWHDWPEDLRADCHKKDTGRTYGSVYGRMEWDAPSPTLTTQFIGFGNGRFGHPEQNRALSLREGAVLQTFPKDYSFVPEGAPVFMSRVSAMIGNAVPVNLAEYIGRSIVNHVKGIQEK